MAELDGRSLGVADGSGVPQEYLETDAPAALEWAGATDETYRADMEPFVLE